MTSCVTHYHRLSPGNRFHFVVSEGEDGAVALSEFEWVHIHERVMRSADPDNWKDYQAPHPGTKIFLSDVGRWLDTPYGTITQERAKEIWENRGFYSNTVGVDSGITENEHQIIMWLWSQMTGSSCYMTAFFEFLNRKD